MSSNLRFFKHGLHFVRMVSKFGFSLVCSLSENISFKKVRIILIKLLFIFEKTERNKRMEAADYLRRPGSVEQVQFSLGQLAAQVQL